jgi:glycosyltransferase involved in cell wall biosynthesis
MDDWPETINKPGILYYYWKGVIDKEFRQLLDNSSVLMSICDSMSETYKIRYNKEFIPFHNPIDTKSWLPFSKKDWAIKGKFKILYAGRIGLGMKNTIVDIAEVVNKLSLENYNIIFEILSNDILLLKRIIKFNDHINGMMAIKHSEMPEKFSSVDLLVLPVDFDVTSVKFMKYSFPTKLSEYMISGTPILVYAPVETAVAKFTLNKRIALLVAEKNKMQLTKAIIDLHSDHSLRKELSERAREFATKYEDAEIVRENFRKCLIINDN